MWEPIWNHAQLQLYMDTSDRRVALHIPRVETVSKEPDIIHLEPTDLVGLIAALLAAHRHLQGKKDFFDD
jgi:hypothetical protein